MTDARRTRDHYRIRAWAEARGGVPTFVQGARGLLRIDFISAPERACCEPVLDEASWQEWFEVFEDRKLLFLYSPEEDSHFFRLVTQRSPAEQPVTTE